MDPPCAPGAGPHSRGMVRVCPGVPSPEPGQGEPMWCLTLGQAWHTGTQRLTRDPQLTIEDVKLVCRVTKPCKRASPGQSPCLGTWDSPALHHRDTVGHSPILAPCTPCPWGGCSVGTDPTCGPPVGDTGPQAAQTRVDVSPPPHAGGDGPHPPLPSPSWPQPSPWVPLLPGDCVPPTVRGEVVGDIFAQAHGPDALLKLVHDSIADLAGPSCVGRETPSAASSSAPKTPVTPVAKLKAKGSFSSEELVTGLPPHTVFGDKTLRLGTRTQISGSGSAGALMGIP